MNQSYMIKSFVKNGFFILFFSVLIFALLGINLSLEAAIPQGNMSIEYRAGKVSAVLKGVEIKKALEDIAQKTGIVFVGLNDVTGSIEDLEFKDLSVEEAIKALGQNCILIFRKEGDQKDKMNIKKVIILAQKEPEKTRPAPPKPPVRPPVRPVPPPPPPKPVVKPCPF